MKSEKKENKLQKICQNKKGKAGLKLGMWFFFFVIVGIFLAMTKPQNKVEQKNDSSNLVNFISLKEMIKTLKTSDYNYDYQINLEGDSIKLKGEKRENTEIGYRESKIGIIKYKKENNKVYQIFQETEEEMTNFLDREDEKMLKIETIEEKMQTYSHEEQMDYDKRTITYYGEETIIITTDRKNITRIQIQTANKNYNLRFEIQ